MAISVPPDSCGVLDPPLLDQIRVMAISVPPDSCGVLDPPLPVLIRVMAIFVPPGSVISDGAATAIWIIVTIECGKVLILVIEQILFTITRCSGEAAKTQSIPEIITEEIMFYNCFDLYQNKLIGITDASIQFSHHEIHPLIGLSGHYQKNRLSFYPLI